MERSFIKNLQNKNLLEAGKQLRTALADKVLEALAIKKIELAESMGGLFAEEDEEAKQNDELSDKDGEKDMEDPSKKKNEEKDEGDDEDAPKNIDDEDEEDKDDEGDDKDVKESLADARTRVIKEAVSRKDFEAQAADLKAHKKMMGPQAHASMVSSAIERNKKANPRFDAHRFGKAAGLHD